MNTAQTADILWIILALVLVSSALFAGRWSFRGALGMALGWVVIFAGVLVVLSYRTEITQVAGRVQSEITNEPRQETDGQTLRIAMSPDGHFWVNARVNGNTTRFLVDSGASVTGLSERAALDAVVDMDTLRAPITLNTANGTIEAQRGTVKEMQVGPITARDVPIVMSPAFGDVNVLGMSFLSQLKSWRVENGEMVLEPR